MKHGNFNEYTFTGVLAWSRPTLSQFACSVHTCIFESIEGSLNLKHVKTTALFNQHELGAKFVHDVVIVLNFLLRHSHMCIG